VLKEWVNGLYDNMLADRVLGQRLKAFMQTAPHDFYMQHLKDRTVDYLECVWAGDQWEGQDLFAAHMHLQLTPDHFDRAIKCGEAKLKKMKFSGEIKKEVLEEMRVMKEPITDPQGKFRRWVEKRNENLEAQSRASAENLVDVGGMGFTTDAKTIQMWADADQKKQAQRERLAAARAKRNAENAEAAKKHGAAKENSAAKEKGYKKAPKEASGQKVLKAVAKPAKTVLGAEVSKANGEMKNRIMPADRMPLLPEDVPPASVPESCTTSLLLSKSFTPDQTHEGIHEAVVEGTPPQPSPPVLA